MGSREARWPPVSSASDMLFFTAPWSRLLERHRFDAQALLIASSVSSFFPVSPPRMTLCHRDFSRNLWKRQFAAFFLFQSEDQNVFQNFQKSAGVVCRRAAVVRFPLLAQASDRSLFQPRTRLRGRMSSPLHMPGSPSASKPIRSRRARSRCLGYASKRPALTSRVSTGLRKGRKEVLQTQRLAQRTN